MLDRIREDRMRMAEEAAMASETRDQDMLTIAIQLIQDGVPPEEALQTAVEAVDGGGEQGGAPQQQALPQPAN